MKHLVNGVSGKFMFVYSFLSFDVDFFSPPDVVSWDMLVLKSIYTLFRNSTPVKHEVLSVQKMLPSIFIHSFCQKETTSVTEHDTSPKECYMFYECTQSVKRFMLHSLQGKCFFKKDRTSFAD
jgi:hypothetical protein